MNRRVLLPAAVLASLAVAGCGGGSSSSKPASSGGGGAASNPNSPAALAADAKSAKTGDIPDTQVFLTFKDPGAGYSIKYPEGWTRQGAGRLVSFRDKNNLIRVVVEPGGSASVAQVEADLARLRAQTPSLKASAPSTANLPGAGTAVKISYTTLGPQDPVTGKQVTLLVDRYVVARGGKRAIIDLGTPRGVDNLDAYKLIVKSFKWQ
jgi:hypothetical protein